MFLTSLISARKLLLMKFTDYHFQKFLLAGALNTLFTYLIYLLLLNFTDYRISFTCSFVIGIIISYALNSFMVFGVSLSWRKLFQYPVIYFIQYALAFVLLNIEVEMMGLDPRIAPLINVVLLIPLTFLLTKYILTRRN